MFAKLRDFDLYRKIPKDLTESSTAGTFLSICASVFMLILFIAELWAFLSLRYTTNIIIDPNTQSLLEINFNITTLDLPCEFAMIDVIDVLGTRHDNVTKNINKWAVDEQGLRRGYEGRNVAQKDIMHDQHHNIEELHRNGVHAVPMDEQSFDHWIQTHDFTFVNFYAPWCIWCQRLEPVWEAFAEEMEIEHVPISIVKVDCVANQRLCMHNKVQAFPMLRMFKGGQPQSPDYRNDRTVDALKTFVHSRLNMEEHLKSLSDEELQQHHEEKEAQRTDHPGCMMTGTLLVNRVPGNFHIEARSSYHNINPVMANLSHVVNSLTFGEPLTRRTLQKLQRIPDEFFDEADLHRMDGRFYVIDHLHQAFHHYIKVVSTHVQVNHAKRKDQLLVYQMVESSQLMNYQEDDVPEARFSYDLSPMSVVISSRSKRLYEFITSICALIGGTFTVVGLLSGFLNVLFKSKKI